MGHTPDYKASKGRQLDPDWSALKNVDVRNKNVHSAVYVAFQFVFFSTAPTINTDYKDKGKLVFTVQLN